MKDLKLVFQHGFVVVASLLLLLVHAPPALAQGGKQITLYYYVRTNAAKAGGKSAGPFTSNNNHPLLDGAIIGVSWPETEPQRGRFDWSVVDRYVADRTVGGKPLVLQVVPYTQIPLAGDSNGDNSLTPQWVYAEGVPRISFTSGGAGRGRKVSIPKVWDPAFYPVYEEYVRALAAKVGSDPRIAGIDIGVGHNGNLTAQPSREGGPALRAAGWTLDVWAQHTERLIDIFVKHFPGKKLFIQVSGLYARHAMLGQNLDVTKRILRYAAERRVSILFRFLDPDVDKFNRTRVRELVAYLATVNPPPGFSIGFADDWPLWVPEARSGQCPGPTCGRDVTGFTRELQLALDVWSSARKAAIPLFLVFNEPETTATNPNDRGFNKAVYDVTVAVLSGQPVATQGESPPAAPPTRERHRKRERTRPE